MQTPEGQWYTLDELIERLLESMRAQPGEARLALTISGGGAAGTYQAGILKTLVSTLHARAAALGHPDLIPQIVVGTSTGALNAYSLLVESLRLTYPAPTPAGTFAAELWEAIDRHHNGSRYVSGARAYLVKLATRPVLKWLLAGLSGGLLAGMAWLAWTNPDLPSRPLVALLALGPIAAWAFFRRSILRNTALSATLTNALVPVRPARKLPSLTRRLKRLFAADEMAEAGQRLVSAWQAAPVAAERKPDQAHKLDFILTATDLSTKRETLFTLVSAETFRRLVHHEWFAFQVASDTPALPAELADRPYGRVEPREFLRCVVASTSIPAVFPSQGITLRRAVDDAPVIHDFVDGGVLNNVPMHVAIDAGATHVLSIELNDLVEEGPLALPSERPRPADWPPDKPWPPEHAEPNLMANLGGTFSTLLDFATREEIRHATEWNRRLNPEGTLGSLRFTDPAQVATADKRTVLLFRVAPVGAQKVTLVEFDGHFGNRLFAPEVSLTEWLEEGARDTASEPLFWDATLGATPTSHPTSGPRASGLAQHQAPTGSASAASESTPSSFSTKES